MNITLVLLIIAAVLFLLDVVLVQSKVNLVALGLFFGTLGIAYKFWVG